MNEYRDCDDTDMTEEEFDARMAQAIPAYPFEIAAGYDVGYISFYASDPGDIPGSQVLIFNAATFQTENESDFHDISGFQPVA